jgi:SAM-dependent methyltransferase
MDVTTAYAEYLRGHGVEFVSDLLQLAGQQFDLVILSHVLEHLLEPARMLKELGALLKTDGMLLVIVPLESPARKVSSQNNNHHLFSWNVNTFNEFLAACNYAVRSCAVKRYGFDRYAAELAIRLSGGYRLYKLLLTLFRIIRLGYEIQVTACCKVSLQQ